MDPWAWIARFKTRPPWALAISLVNVPGVAYGLSFYGPQFAATPFPLWPFVADTPIALLWAQLALAAHWVHRWRGGQGEAPGVLAALLDALAVVGCLQVGVWAIYALAAHDGAWVSFGPAQSAALLVGHVAMLGLALPFLPGVRERARTRPAAQAWGIAGAAAFFLAQDALDYVGPDYMGRGCGMRPHLVACGPAVEAALGTLAFGMTALGVGLLVAVGWARRARGRAASASAP
ncbi:MAG TPA: DUF1405 domain-containing protein [Candidatus Thermoplasmatota archaeon]|nr:DUF1405 domain-containing protein [Candidatus Thermoplasmatota archaeon]